MKSTQAIIKICNLENFCINNNAYVFLDNRMIIVAAV